MGWIIPNSAVVGFSKRAARPMRRGAVKRRRQQDMSVFEILEEFANAARILRARGAEMLAQKGVGR